MVESYSFLSFPWYLAGGTQNEKWWAHGSCRRWVWLTVVNTSFDLEQEEVYKYKGCQLAPNEDLLIEISCGFVCDSWRACAQKGLLCCCPLSNLLSAGFDTSWSDTEWWWLGWGTTWCSLFIVIFGGKKKDGSSLYQHSWLCVTYWSYLIKTINNLHLITLYKASLYHESYFAIFMLKSLWDASWCPEPCWMDVCGGRSHQRVCSCRAPACQCLPANNAHAELRVTQLSLLIACWLLANQCLV